MWQMGHSSVSAVAEGSETGGAGKGKGKERSHKTKVRNHKEITMKTKK